MGNGTREVSAVRDGQGAPVLELRAVSKSFGDFHALDEVSLDVYEGEVVVIIGPSGSGKSTLVRCVDLLEMIDAGSIRLDDEFLGFAKSSRGLRMLSGRRMSEQRARMGMVFQSFNLFPHLTVLENICHAPVHVHRIGRREAQTRALELLALVGLESKAGSYPSMLSGGEQQRVAIARVLAVEPRILLFDEPTSALDPELVGSVLGVIRQLAGGGRTMIVVTHDMAFAKEVADWCIFMQNGRILESGTPQELFEAPKTENLRTFLRMEGL